VSTPFVFGTSQLLATYSCTVHQCAIRTRKSSMAARIFRTMGTSRSSMPSCACTCFCQPFRSGLDCPSIRRRQVCWQNTTTRLHFFLLKCTKLFHLLLNSGVCLTLPSAKHRWTSSNSGSSGSITLSCMQPKTVTTLTRTKFWALQLG
jgi:hypothetical protein